MCFMLPLLLAFFSSVSCLKVCQIDVPIGVWLKDNANGSCEIVKGHFILDGSANSVSAKIYRTFKGLKRVEGCLYVKNYTGSRNLSFFSKVEEIICDKTAANVSNFDDVIHVHEPYLYTMGFDSLRNVTGPGEIFLSFEDIQETYQALYYKDLYENGTRFGTEGRECFSKKEMVFFARHPQFIGKMYRACETNDPCFRPELFKDFYTFEDIPDNCTTFAGLACIVGAYPQDLRVFNKLKNLTVLIGQVEVGPTLFSSLEMFSNLEVIYPYMNGHPWHPCYDSFFNFDETRGVQRIFVGVSRFLTNISLPSLQPFRPLLINHPIATRAISAFAFDYVLYFPDRLTDPCSQFAQFGKNCKLGEYQMDGVENGRRVVPYVEAAWLVGTIFVIIGCWYGKRCLVAIATRQLGYTFGKSQYLIGIVFLIMVLSAIEAIIINQVAYDTMKTKSMEHYIFAQFNSQRLLEPFSLVFIKLLAACRQTSLIILILCYFDVILSYSWMSWNLRFSRLYLIFSSTTSFAGLIYFYSQLVIEIRAIRPHYTDAVNANGLQSFLTWSPGHTTVPIQRGYVEFIMTRVPGPRNNFIWTYFGPSDMQLEILGGAFPIISLCCDVIFSCLIIGFVALKLVKRSKSRDNLLIFILLYVQMSMYRIRSFICCDILAEFIDHGTDERPLQDRLFYPPKPPRDYEEAIWKIIRMVEKSPYCSFMITSYLCWNYIQYYRRLGLALMYRERREKTEAMKLEDSISGYNTISITGKQETTKSSQRSSEKE